MQFNNSVNRMDNYLKPNSYSRVQPKQIYFLNRLEASADYQIISLILEYIHCDLSPCSLPNVCINKSQMKTNSSR